MITLITGVPGAGKTSEAVTELLQAKGTKYTVGCPVKGIAEVEFAAVKDLQNATILIDEAHFFLNDASFQQFLTVHRHSGLDFIFTTQDFSLLPRKVLPLVGKHRHLSVNPLGERRILEWDRYGNPRSTRDVEAAHKTFGKVNRESWGKFDSVKEGSDMPPVKKARKPRKIFIFAGVSFLLLLGVLFFGNLTAIAPLYGGSNEWDKEIKVDYPTTQQDQATPTVVPSFTPPVTPPVTPSVATAESQEEAEKEVLSEPEIVGCVRNDTRCNCYTAAAKLVRSETECSLRGI